MLLLTKIDKFTDKSGGELKASFAKVESTKNNELFFTYFYKAPVSFMKSEKCNELLDSNYLEMTKRDGGLAELLQIISYFRMTPDQAFFMLRDSRVKVVMMASENSELRVTCNR